MTNPATADMRRASNANPSGSRAICSRQCTSAALCRHKTDNPPPSVHFVPHRLTDPERS